MKRNYQGETLVRIPKAMRSVPIGKAVAALASAGKSRKPSVFRTGGFSLSSLGGNELNYNDTFFSQEISTTPTVTLLNGLQLGTTATTRMGQKIRIKSVQLKLNIRPDSLALGNIYRMVLVFDKQSNAAAPAWTDVFSVSNPASLRNPANMGRFQIIWDSGQMYNIGNTATAGQATEKSISCIDAYKKLNLLCTYNTGNAGTIGDIQTGGFFLMHLGTTGTGAATVELAGYIRIRFQA